MSLWTKKLMLVALASVILGAGVWVGLFGFLNPLQPPSSERELLPPVTNEVNAEKNAPTIKFANLLARRLQNSPPKPPPSAPATNEQTDTETIPTPVVVSAPTLSVIGISRSPRHSIASIRNDSSNEIATGFVGDKVFDSLIKEIDFDGRRVLVVHKENDFWIPLRKVDRKDLTKSNR